LRKLVPEEKLEAAASQQYLGIKQQAHQRGALVPDEHPQVVRLLKRAAINAAISAR
jgi:hypothetical protein